MTTTANPQTPDEPIGANERHGVEAEHVEALAAANAASNKTLINLVEKVAEDAYMRERKVELLDRGMRQTRKLLFMLGIGLLLLVTIATINAVNIASTRKNAAVTAQAARDAKATNDLLFGCFEPNSQCAKLNVQKQAELLNEIKKYELVALYCIRTNPGAEDPEGVAFLACVNRLYPGGPQLDKR